MSPRFVLVFLILTFILGGLLYIYNPEPTEYRNPNEEEPVFCTADAKLCADGTYVGRTGPNCEFVCPEPVSEVGTTTNPTTE